MILKRIGPWSAAKLSAVMYGVFGLIGGFFFSLMSLFTGPPADAGMGFNMLFGVGAIIILPVFYGVMGLIAGLLGAGIYNLVAGFIGGLELDLQ